MKASSASPALSVVVPCLGHAEELKDCLRSLSAQAASAPFEVIVVDSASDPAVVAVTRGFAQVRLVQSEARLFPGGARNLGAQRARGRYLAFTDADCTAEPGWLEAALLGLQAGHKLVGGPVLDRYPLHPVRAVDNLLQFADHPRQRPDGPAQHFPACNLALSREAFEDLGGFPPSIGIGQDVLFSDAARRRWPEGLQFINAMRVRHAGRADLPAFWQHQWGFGYARGRYALRLKPTHRQRGRKLAYALYFAYRRAAYFAWRALQWHPLDLLRLAVLSPLLLVGLSAYGIGFRRGCRQALAENS